MGRNDDTVLARLADIAVFRHCSKKELHEVTRLSTEVTVPEGRTLTTEGERGHEFAIVLSGTASVSRGGAVIATLAAGDHYGEMALLDDGPRTATIVATSPMSLAVVGRAEFGQLLEDVPALAVSILRGMARRLRELDASPAI
ncbi:cyclic nucleotide-binding domain-containing protein [Jatrophihabitans sp.]|uniref:Crp/Fnr family transcriptional regulator n=1 Tax=Jatrophihabitans sp. TaxID=1932789 RepID=UPI0030C6B39D|nr:cyclic nucleotide-binding protein [Jatrophihabitans sp.]